jgi:hypothetical protein
VIEDVSRLAGQHNRLQALALLAKMLGLVINRQQVSGPGGGPVEVVDHAAPLGSTLSPSDCRRPASSTSMLGHHY